MSWCSRKENAALTKTLDFSSSPQFKSISRMPPEEKKIIKALLEGMIIKHQTRLMVSGLSG